MVLCAGIILIILGLLGKFGALFVTIPNPVIGGVFMVMFGKKLWSFFPFYFVLKVECSFIVRHINESVLTVS